MFLPIFLDREQHLGHKRMDMDKTQKREINKKRNKISKKPIFYKIDILQSRLKKMNLETSNNFFGNRTARVLCVVIYGLIVCDILQTQYILTNLFKKNMIFFAYF